MVSQTSGVKVVSICSFDFFLRGTSGVRERPEEPKSTRSRLIGVDGAANIRRWLAGWRGVAHDFLAAAGSMRKAEAMSRAQAAVAKERILGASLSGWKSALCLC